MKLLSISQVAEQLGVSRATLGRMVTEGVLPVIVLRSGKRKRILKFRQEIIDRWLLRLEQQDAGRNRANGIDRTKTERGKSWSQQQVGE